MSHLLIVHNSLLYLFLFFWHNPGCGGGGDGKKAHGCARSGAIHHALLTGIFKDKTPSAAAIHQP